MTNLKVKAHWGRIPAYQYWALSIADTSTKLSRAFITHIENKNASTIFPIIKYVIRAGSIIYTDEAKVYKQTSKDSNYQHLSVIYKYEFVNYETGTHKQHVESLNNRLKKVLKDMYSCLRERENFIVKSLKRNNEKASCRKEH